MKSLERQPSAYFEHELDTSFTSKDSSNGSSKGPPKFYRVDWEGVNLPRQPSLKLKDDEMFFELIGCNAGEETKKKRDSFSDFVSRAENVSDSEKNHNLAEKPTILSTSKHIRVPLHIRKLEIELIQRSLPRYPSQSHLSDPSFYPLASCALFETRRRNRETISTDPTEKEAQERKVPSTEIDEDETVTTMIIADCLDDEEDHGMPKTQEREMEVPPAQIHKDDVSTTSIEIGYSDEHDSYEIRQKEDDEDMRIAETITPKTEASSIQMDRNNTSENDTGETCISSEENIIEESSVQVDQEDTSTIDIEIERFDDSVEFLDESYYSESDEFEEDMEVDNILEELIQLKMIYSQSVENTDLQQSDSSVNTDENDDQIMLESSDTDGNDDQIMLESSDTDGNDDQSLSESSLILDEDVNQQVPDPNLDIVTNDDKQISNLSFDNDKNVGDSMNERKSKISWRETYKSQCSSIPFSSQCFTDDEPYELKIGVVHPMIRAMVFQARMELRCRKVPEEHIRKFKPSLSKASEMGQATRLDEHTIEARGVQYVKHDPAVLPSVIWVKGGETVELPKLHTRPQLTIFKEAIALGGIKALKPKITTNYGQRESIYSSMTSLDDDIVDADDAGKHKLMRTKYLTDIYLLEYQRSYDDDDDDEPLHYESLDDVGLPASDCPSYTYVGARKTKSELKDLIAQQVAEKVWERRYRLERPRARQRIMYQCNCKFCKTSNPYQTFAYRKRWLKQQNLWNEPPEDNEIEDSNDQTTEEMFTDEKNKETALKKSSIRTASTRKLSIDLQTSSDSEELQLSDDNTVNTRNSFHTSQSLERSEVTENATSTNLKVHGDRFNSNESSADMGEVSSPSEISIILSTNEVKNVSKKSSISTGGALSPSKSSIIAPSLSVSDEGKEGKAVKNQTFKI